MRTSTVVCATNSESNCRLGFDEFKVGWALNIRKLTAPLPPQTKFEWPNGKTSTEQKRAYFDSGNDLTAA